MATKNTTAAPKAATPAPKAAPAKAAPVKPAPAAKAAAPAVAPKPAAKPALKTPAKPAAAPVAAAPAAAAPTPAKTAPKAVAKAPAAPASAPVVTAPAKAAAKVKKPAAEATANTEADGDDDAAETGKTVGRKEVAEALRTDLKSKGFAVSEKLAKEIVASFEQAVIVHLAAGEAVGLPGFGKFKLSMRAAGESRNPRTGETTPRAATWAASFKVGKNIKDVVSQLAVPEEVAAEAAA